MQLPFHLFVSSIYLINLLQFSGQRSFTSLVKFIPKYFIAFGTIVNRINIFISFLENLLCVEMVLICVSPFLNSLIKPNLYIYVYIYIYILMSLYDFLYTKSCLQIETILLLPF